MLHRRIFPREELEEMSRYLAQKYPAAFFAEPALKRPLRRTSSPTWNATTRWTVTNERRPSASILRIGITRTHSRPAPSASAWTASGPGP